MTGVVFSTYTHTHILEVVLRVTVVDGVILQERMLSGIEQHTSITSPARLRNATSCYVKSHSLPVTKCVDFVLFSETE